MCDTYFQDCVPGEGRLYGTYFWDFETEEWEFFTLFGTVLPTESGAKPGRKLEASTFP